MGDQENGQRDDRREDRNAKSGEEPQRLDIRQALAKAAVMTGRQVDEPSAIAEMEERRDAYGDVGAVDPPYDPESLLNYIELTPHVSPNISSYQNNIDGYGYRSVLIEPWMEDLKSKEAREAVANAIMIERWVEEEEAALAAAAKARKAEEGVTAPGIEEPTEEPLAGPEGGEGQDDDEADGSDGVTDEEIDAAIEKLRVQIRRDRFLFDSFFKTCCSKMSFVKLKRITRYDIEGHGWGAWEMLNDGLGRLKRLNYIPGYTVRPLKDEGELVDTVEPDPITPLSEGREVTVPQRFRRFVQIVGSQKVYYKSPGDPRIVSRTTGKIYDSLQAMRKPADADDPGEGKDAVDANELIYYSLHDPRTPCPPPRWIGNLLAVLGVREADETNYFYLDASAIPPGILFVAGGKVPRDMKDRLEGRLTSEFAGAENRHKILVVEAHPMKLKGEERTLLPSMEFESLREAQQTDATFTKYDERSADRIGASFRLPPMLRGYTPKDLNRATAIAALGFAEGQVFGPEREDMDWTINKYILPRIGVKLHAFKSNSPPTRSPEEIAELIRVSAPHGGILPYEIRNLIGESLNTPLAKVTDKWAFWPMPMTLAGLGEGSEAAPETGGIGDGTGDGEDDAAALTLSKVVARIDELQKRVAAIVTEELRSIGFEGDVTARVYDAGGAPVDGDTEGGE
jgi:PBSX family phage portal protein